MLAGSPRVFYQFGMKLVILILWGLFTVVAAGQSGEPVIRTIDPKVQPKLKSLNPEYLVFTPDKSPEDERVPLLIYLHGAGGIGDNIGKIKGQPKRVWEGIKKFNVGPCLVVAPQCLKKPKEGPDAGWLPDDLNLLFEEVMKNFSIDRTRVYLTGNSMGGYGSWAWGGHSPQYFAAIAPVVGGIGPGGPKDVTSELEKWAANLAKVPVYAFAGAKDRVVPAERSERMIKAIRNAGGKDAKLKVYPGEGHGAGRVVFSSKEFYDWMFSKKRDSRKN